MFHVMDFFKKNRDIFVFACGIAVYAALAYILHLPCPIYYITGISCPGCGMTRALFAALRLDFAAAFHYHPLWIGLPFAIFTLIILRDRNRLAFRFTLYVCIALLLLTYILRICIDSDIVSLDFRNGLIYRLFARVSDYLL